MKRNFLLRSVLCAAAACLMLVGSASAYAALTPETAAAYQGVMDDLAGRYGNVWVAGGGSPVEGMYLGLACAQLIDFDDDGTPELYCAYGVAADNRIHQVLYTYDDGLIRLNIPEEVSNFSTDVAPVTRIYTGVGKAYLVDGHEVINGNEVRYLTKKGNHMVPELTYTDGLISGQHVRRVNGEGVSQEELKRRTNRFTLDMKMTEYSYFENGDGADPTATIPLVLEEIRSRTVILAEPGTAHLQVMDSRTDRNGNPVWPEGYYRIDLAAYMIDGNNYLKLRDLAAALNASPRQFAVGWDVETRCIRVVTGRRYVTMGGELAPQAGQAAKAELAATPLIINGDARTPTTYLIDQNHYYRLRDLTDVLGLSVSWEPHTKTAILTPQ